jgi:Uma2 family endonuclease
MPTQETLSDYERERGKPMPSKLHSVVQTNLTVLLAAHRPQYTVFSELTLRLDEMDVTPDLCVYENMTVDFTHDEVRVTDPPVLAIEIASPTQGIQNLVQKARDLLANGVQSCWLVQPQLKTITVFTGEMESTTYSDGTVTDPVTDISVTLDDVFTSAGGEGRRE